MLTNLIIALGLGACVGVGNVLPMAENTYCETRVESKVQPKYASYDDVHSQITLTAYELNNYSWDNFYSAVIEEGGFSTVLGSFTYGTYDIIYTSFDDYWYLYSEEYNGEFSFYFVIDYIEFNEQYESNLTKGYVWFNTGGFEESFTFGLDSGVYSTIKSAIELDIEANYQPSMMNPLVEIITLLTGGIVQFATGIGSGVSSLVSNIMVTDGHLSVFFAIACVFAGISLAVGLSRWVMNFLTSLGAKK